MPSSNVVIYARYSSDNQREESIEGQLRECRAYAERNDMKIIGRPLHRPCVVSQDGRAATVPEDDPRQQRPQVPIRPCVEAGPILPQPL